MAGHFVAAWFFVKQERPKGALSIVVVHDGCENDCVALCCGYNYNMDITWCGDRDDDLLLRDNFRVFLFDDREVYIMMLTFLLRSLISISDICLVVKTRCLGILQTML